MFIQHVAKNNNIINFAEIKNLIFCDKSSSVKIKEYRVMALQTIVSVLDTHYISFISYRKERDGFLIFLGMSKLMESISYSGSAKHNFALSDMFYVNNKRLITNMDVYPIDIDSLLKKIVLEVSILRAVHGVFTYLFEKWNVVNLPECIELKQNVDTKMSKIQSLNDRNILTRMTHDSAFIDNVLSNIVCCDINCISADMEYYNQLLIEIEQFLPAIENKESATLTPPPKLKK